MTKTTPKKLGFFTRLLDETTAAERYRLATEQIVQADPRWQEAMRRRGVTDFSLTMIDPWASSWTGPEDDASVRRITRPLTWLRAAPGEHGYARPVGGLVCTVDLDAREGRPGIERRDCRASFRPVQSVLVRPART